MRSTGIFKLTYRVSTLLRLCPNLLVPNNVSAVLIVALDEM